MLTLLPYAALAALSAALVRVMVGVGALDHPVARSSHTRPTPKGGGVGIVAAYVLGMAWLAHAGRLGATALVTVPAVLLLAVVSYLDDLRSWPFLAKLAAQLAAALVVVAAGAVATQVALPGGLGLDLGVAAGAVLTLGWLLFVTNAVNFIDGLNGLASGCVAIAAVALACRATPPLALPAGVLAAGIAGFLPWNYPNARIFMGDVGSQVIGFLAAWMAVRAADDPRLSLVAPLALLPILLDVAFTLARRGMRGDRLTQAHRGHLYQVANRAGMPAWAVTLVYWGLSALGAALGLAVGAYGGGWIAALAAVLAEAVPFAAWGFWVRHLAKRAGLTAW